MQSFGHTKKETMEEAISKKSVLFHYVRGNEQVLYHNRLYAHPRMLEVDENLVQRNMESAGTDPPRVVVQPVVRHYDWMYKAMDITVMCLMLALVCILLVVLWLGVSQFPWICDVVCNVCCGKEMDSIDQPRRRRPAYRAIPVRRERTPSTREPTPGEILPIVAPGEDVN